MTSPEQGRVQKAAERALARDLAGRKDPEPSLARRFGQIGILGWIVVLPTLGGLFIGHWLDRLLDVRIMFAAALLMVGAAIGLWLSLRWMHEQ